METIEIKSYLHKFIENIDDVNLLKAVYILLEKNIISKKDKDFWFELPEQVKTNIDIAVAEADRGELISHKEAKRKIKEKVKQL